MQLAQTLALSVSSSGSDHFVHGVGREGASGLQISSDRAKALKAQVSRTVLHFHVSIKIRPQETQVEPHMLTRLR